MILTRKQDDHLISWENLQKPMSKGGLGINSTRQLNAAFLTKLGWRMISEPESLWSRVLRHKYCSGRCDLDMFDPKKGSSNVWQGITKNATILGKGMRVAVGNGNRTLSWDHRWACAQPLNEVSTQLIPSSIAGATVVEMWDEIDGWKWDCFAPYLAQENLKIIQSFELKDYPELGDLVYWQGGSKGKLSIKSALSIMRNESDSIDEEC